MRNTYDLQIGVEKEELIIVDRILGVTHNTTFGWELELEEEGEYIDYINYFLDILEGKYEALEQAGITRDMISIWRYYDYDKECNLQFSPQELKRMGDNGITLCISCYENDETYDHDVGGEKILN